MTAVGTRVTAIMEARDGVVRSFGDGVYAGDFDLPPDAGGFNFGQKNPRIDAHRKANAQAQERNL